LAALAGLFARLLLAPVRLVARLTHGTPTTAQWWCMPCPDDHFHPVCLLNATISEAAQ
jgi:hypothetical protein